MMYPGSIWLSFMRYSIMENLATYAQFIRIFESYTSAHSSHARQALMSVTRFSGFGVVCVLLLCTAARALSVDPDVNHDVCEMVWARGRPCERHAIVTSDGFILQTERIPNATGPAVILQHGLYCASSIFFLSYEDTLPYTLADAGFDVWIVNSRGRPYRRAYPYHTTLLPTDPRSWNWTADDMVAKDIPAAVQYVSNVSSFDFVAALIGHSQGAFVVWAASTVEGVVSEKVKLVVPLAGSLDLESFSSNLFNGIAQLDNPSVFHSNEKRGPRHSSLWSAAASELEASKSEYSCFGVGIPMELCCDRCPPGDKYAEEWPGCCSGVLGLTSENRDFRDACEISPTACAYGICAVCGCESVGNMNHSRIPVVVTHFPAMTTQKNLGSMMSIGNGFFPKNLLVPIAAYAGKYDRLAGADGTVQALKGTPPDLIVDSNTSLPFGHLDFVMGLNAKAELYDHLSTLIWRQWTSEPSP